MKIFLKIEEINSTNIKSMSYLDNTETKTLVVDFVNGESYVYSGVPFPVVAKLFSVDSIGTAFYREIVSGNYSYKKI